MPTDHLNNGCAWENDPAALTAMLELERAQAHFNDARLALHSAICAAADAGVPARTIARTLALSPGFVRQALARRPGPPT